MATRKTREEAEEVWNMLRKAFPTTNLTVKQDEGGIHILQVLKCRVCGQEILTHAIGQHDGECTDCKAKAERKAKARGKQLKAEQYASERAYQKRIDLFGDE